MNDQILKNCTLLLDSQDRIKTVFGWDSGLIHLACAGIYVSKEKEVNVSVMRSYKFIYLTVVWRSLHEHKQTPNI